MVPWCLLQVHQHNCNISSLLLRKVCSARLNVLLHDPAGAEPWVSRGQLLSAWPREALSRGSQAAALASDPVPRGWLGTRQCDECSFYLLAFLVFLFCGFGFLWGLNVKMVLLVAKDDQAPGTALLAGDLGQQGTSILPALRGLC